MIQTQIEENRFSFVEFYLRRAKRLLPAALVTFSLTALAAPYFLGAIELDDLRGQLVGALTFTSNFVLWGQAGYFDTAAELKPLLHIWSLSLEEQYYVILPLMLFFAPRRVWTPITAILLAASIAICWRLMSSDPDAAFYLLPSRAWELSVGSIVALTRADLKWSETVKWIFWPAVAVLVVLPFYPTGLPHPGLDAAIVCAATAVIIVRGSKILGYTPATSWLAWVGNPSYSLYLAHWPVVAFANSAYIGEMGAATRFLLIFIGAAFGLLIYYLVERPIHKAKSTPALLRRSGIAASVVFLAAVGYPLQVNSMQGEMDFKEIRKANYGLGGICNRIDGFKSIDQCKTGPNPEIFVWGDSYAMHLIQGLIASSDVDIEQATLSACPPSTGYAVIAKGSPYTTDRAIKCLTYNQQTFDYLVSNPDIETVVISSPFSSYLPRKGWVSLVPSGDGYEEREISADISKEILAASIDGLQKVGKKVVIVTPPPSSGDDTSICAERLLTGKFIFGRASCDISVEADRRYYRSVLDFLDEVSKKTGAPIFDFRDILCDGKICMTILEGTPIYRDNGHFSVSGSEKMGVFFDLTRRILAAKSPLLSPEHSR